MITGLVTADGNERYTWIDQDTLQEKIWFDSNMSASPDQLLVTPTDGQKSPSAVFEVPTSELKKNYKFCTTPEKSLTGSTEHNSQLFERPPWQKLLLIFFAELIGTACLMFFGCMGLVSKSRDGELSPYSGAISFACVVAVVIVMIGHISNCHINPCVTLCAVLLGKLPLITALVYFVAEFSGALIGYGTLVALAPYNILDPSEGVCVTTLVSGITETQGLLIEAITTGLLMLLVCAVWDPRSGNGDCASLKFLVIIFLTSVVVGPFTGNSLNPVRSLAPAIYNNSWTSHWIYWVGPFSGTIVSTLFYKYVFMALDSGERDK